MERIAFFVEGQTEQIFVNRLIKEILGPQRTNIIQKKIKGGTTVPRQEIVRDLAFSRQPWYEILIYDCGSDNRVKSEMLDNVENLKRQGYNTIIGLRDLYPLPMSDLDRLQKGARFMPSHLRNLISHFSVIIAVQEVETWFLAETNHFQRIDRRLTRDFIRKRLDFDPYTVDPVSRAHPSQDLDDIYRLIGRSYTKRYGPTRRVINRLDYRNIIGNVCNEISSLRELVSVLQKAKANQRKKQRRDKKN